MVGACGVRNSAIKKGTAPKTRELSPDARWSQEDDGAI